MNLPNGLRKQRELRFATDLVGEHLGLAGGDLLQGRLDHLARRYLRSCGIAAARSVSMNPAWTATTSVSVGSSRRDCVIDQAAAFEAA